MNHPSKDVDKDIIFSARNRNILFKHNILCRVGFNVRTSEPHVPWEVAEGHAMDSSIAYRRRSFRKSTLRFLVPTQIKLAIACCFSLLALVSYTLETLQLPSFPTFLEWMVWHSLNSSFRQSQTKKLGHEVSSSLPSLSMLIIRWFFPFLMEKTRYYPTMIRWDGGCVIQLRCPNYFSPELQVLWCCWSSHSWFKFALVVFIFAFYRPLNSAYHTGER